jgi:tyrosine-protein kinase Tec
MMQEISEFHFPYAMSLCYNTGMSTLRIYLRHLQCVGFGGVGVGVVVGGVVVGGGGGGGGGVGVTVGGGGCSCSGYLFLR